MTQDESIGLSFGSENDAPHLMRNNLIFVGNKQTKENEVSKMQQ